MNNDPNPIDMQAQLNRIESKLDRLLSGMENASAALAEGVTDAVSQLTEGGIGGMIRNLMGHHDSHG